MSGEGLEHVADYECPTRITRPTVDELAEVIGFHMLVRGQSVKPIDIARNVLAAFFPDDNGDDK